MSAGDVGDAGDVDDADVTTGESGSRVWEVSGPAEMKSGDNFPDLERRLYRLGAIL